MHFGLHVSKGKALQDSIAEANEDLEITAVQIYTNGPRNTKRNNLNYQAIKQYCNEQKIKIYNHGSYPSVAIWHVNKHNISEKKDKINHIEQMVKDTKALDGEGVIIHVPRHIPSVIAETMEILNEKFKNDMQYIFLEMPASKPQEKAKLEDLLTYETPEKLNYLVKEIGKIPYKICIDSAHQWAGGVDFSTKEKWESYINGLSADVRKRIKMIHLNGALIKNFGTGKDMHIIPLSEEDGIWGKFVNRSKKNDLSLLRSSGFYGILEYCVVHNVDIICEINRGKVEETEFLFETIHAILRELRV